jgi:hypothetical protein
VGHGCAGFGGFVGKFDDGIGVWRPAGTAGLFDLDLTVVGGDAGPAEVISHAIIDIDIDTTVTKDLV